MNKVEGFNKYCGPAVLSILTGKTTDECAAVIGRVNGKHEIKGVHLTDLIIAADRLGFELRDVNPRGGSLFGTISSIIPSNGMYVMMLPKHFVCIEIKDRQAYFCDNHTKEPIPAASSARLSQQVLATRKVIEYPIPQLISDSLLVIKISMGSMWEVKIYRNRIYDIESANVKINLATFYVNSVAELLSLSEQFKREY